MSAVQRLAPGFLILLATILSGCALTSTETARQLESQEVVLTGSLYYPGFIALPKVSGQATLGFGAGDVSARVGTAFLMNNVGLGMRLYPSDLINLSLQADLGNVLMDFHAPGYRRYAMLTPRVSSSTDVRPFYGGIQSNILYFTVENAYYGEETIFAMAGAFGGIDYPNGALLRLVRVQLQRRNQHQPLLAALRSAGIRRVAALSRGRGLI